MGTVVTPKEVGRFLRLTETTIYKLTYAGELPGFKVGSSWRYYMEEVLESISKTNGGKPMPSDFLLLFPRPGIKIRQNRVGVKRVVTLLDTRKFELIGIDPIPTRTSRN